MQTRWPQLSRHNIHHHKLWHKFRRRRILRSMGCAGPTCQIFDNSLIPPADPRDNDKELSRRYRRTVFTYSDWAKHRSSQRYMRHIISMPTSRIVRGLAGPLALVLSLALAVAAYETYRETGAVQGLVPLAIPASQPFSLTSFALSLLLVFRTNTSYARWDEARKLWGAITNRCRDVVRQAVTYARPGDKVLMDWVPRWSCAFPVALMCHLRDDADLEAALQEVLPQRELQALLASHHRPNYCLQVMGEAFWQHPCLEESEAVRLDQQMTYFADYLGACERIFKTPIPLSWTRHTSRFLMIWLALMPFSLWQACGWGMVPASGIIAFLLLGIEEIGVQIEEPFSILPLEAICATIRRDITAMVDGAGDIKALVADCSDMPAPSSNGASAGRRARPKGGAPTVRHSARKHWLIAGVNLLTAVLNLQTAAVETPL